MIEPTGPILALLAVWMVLFVVGAAYSAIVARRDPLATSLIKIAFAALLLLIFIASRAAQPWLSLDIKSGSFLSAWLALLYWVMTLGGGGLCLGLIAGTLFGMSRSRNA